MINLLMAQVRKFIAKHKSGFSGEQYWMKINRKNKLSLMRNNIYNQIVYMQ